MSGWFSGLGSALDELKQQAIKLSEEAVHTAQVLADEAVSKAQVLKEEAVHTAQALRDAALEANNEILAEQERVKATADPTSTADHVVTLLPWDPEDEAKSILSQPLMEKVFALSLSEDNFQPLAPEEQESFSNFKLENYVNVAMTVLEIDPNLKKMHAKLGARVAEEEFWRSYFFRCACLRAEIGMGSSRDYALTGTTTASPAKAARGSSTSGTADGGGAASVASQGAPTTPSGAAKGGDDASKPVDEEAAALEAAVEEELELEGLEDEIGDVSGVDDQDIDELDAEIAKELGDIA